MEWQRISFEERIHKIHTEECTLNEVFPIAKLSVKYCFAGAVLLARSRYLTWVYNRKLVAYHDSEKIPYNFVCAVGNAYHTIEMDEYERDYNPEEAYNDLYYLMIRPFVEIYETQRKKEREEEENVSTNDIKRNM